MTSPSDPTGPMPDEEALLAAVSKLPRAQVLDLVERLLAQGQRRALSDLESPSQRRPRRDDVVTFRVRVDLDGAKPPLWRRLELASDLTLDELHEVLQIAFGWTNSHLHRFAAGPRAWGPESEHYLCPFDVAEGSQGVPEERVRLDELLVEPKDRFFYEYDYGDGWSHTIRLAAVEERTTSTPAAVCTAGRRPGPPEDCGGVDGYELMVAANDPSHPGHAEALAEVRDLYGEDFDPDWYQPSPFDVDEVNAMLDANGCGA
jgi:hypothetical protein